ncbi:MAG: type IV secretion system protein VirB3 [Bradyrhizobium sp.]
MHKNVLFRGCTRPAMFMGVPYLPFFMAAGACILLTFYIDMYCLLLLPPVIFVMRQMARRDEMIFRLLGLRLQFKLKARNLKHHSGMWVFSSNNYRTKPAKSR